MFGYDAPLTLDDSVSVAVPANMQDATALRLLTTGARTAAGDYVITFTDGVTPTAVTVSVPTLATASRASTGAGFELFNWTGFTNNARAGSNCGLVADNGGNVIDVDVPVALVGSLTGVSIAYTPMDPATPATAHLPGPLSVGLKLSEADYDAAFIYEAEVESDQTTTTAISANVAADNAYFHAISWSALFPTDDSDIYLEYSCGDDGGGGGAIIWDAYQPLPAFGSAVAGEGLAARTSGGSGSVELGADTCAGQYIRIKAELLAAFDQSPELTALSVDFDLDADMDGFTAEGLYNPADDSISATPRAALSDCDDANVAAVLPVQRYTDADGDGFGSVASALISTCTETGFSTTNNDCLDTGTVDGVAAANVQPVSAGGVATTIAGNTVDEDCDGFVECYFDLDGDGARRRKHALHWCSG